MHNIIKIFNISTTRWEAVIWTVISSVRDSDSYEVYFTTLRILLNVNSALYISILCLL